MFYNKKMPHIAFIQTYSGRAVELVTPLVLKNPRNGKEKKILAIWDTGATGTVITKDVFEELDILTIDVIGVSGVNSRSQAHVGIADIVFGDGVLKLTGSRVMACDSIGSEKAKMLIGMDIITMGDMSISNYGDTTHFSFAIPPFENRTNLFDKANAVNKRNKL